jgi:hypothetical protein
MMVFYKEDAYALVSYYHEFGLLSIRNLVISMFAGIVTYLFTNVFIGWERKKKQ